MWSHTNSKFYYSTEYIAIVSWLIIKLSLYNRQLHPYVNQHFVVSWHHVDGVMVFVCTRLWVELGQNVVVVVVAAAVATTTRFI